MPFSDAFSVANPFSVNPQYSNTPQAAQAKKAKAAQTQGQTPESAVTPKAIEPDQWGGVESLANARSSPLLEAIAGYSEPAPQATTPQNFAVPQFAQPAPITPPYPTPTPQNSYVAQLLALLSQAQAAQQMQRIYPNRLVYV